MVVLSAFGDMAVNKDAVIVTFGERY